jgi:hypothetical protein
MVRRWGSIRFAVGLAPALTFRVVLKAQILLPLTAARAVPANCFVCKSSSSQPLALCEKRRSADPHTDPAWPWKQKTPTIVPPPRGEAAGARIVPFFRLFSRLARACARPPRPAIGDP